jgi:hypothetical protein
VRSTRTPGPLDLIRADLAAAQTARNISLADKARIEADELRNAAAARADPALQTEFASHSAGLNLDTGSRLADHIRGVMEQPEAADVQDAEIVGREAQPFRTGAPVIEPQQRNRFQAALAAGLANRLGTGKTNAQQLTAGAGNVYEQDLRSQIVNAPDRPTANRIVSAISERPDLPFSQRGGIVLDEGTGTLAEGGQLATEARKLVGAKAGTETARQTELRDRSGLHRARTKLVGSGKLATPLAPERVARMIDSSAAVRLRAEVAEWDALPMAKRKVTPRPTYDEVREKVRKNYEKKKTITSNPDVLRTDALAAIEQGRDPAAVAARYRELTGLELTEDEDLDDLED